jgi:hypothetical protein
MMDFSPLECSLGCGIDCIAAVIEKSNVEAMHNTQWSLYTFGSIGVLYRRVRKY